MNRLAIEKLLLQRTTAVPDSLLHRYLRYQYRHSNIPAEIVIALSIPAFLAYGYIDALMVPDIGALSIGVRLGHVLLIMLLLVWFYRRVDDLRVWDASMLAVVTLSEGLWFWILSFSDLPVPRAYLMASSIFVIVGCLCVRGLFRYCVVGSACISVVSLAGVAFISGDAWRQALMEYCATYVAILLFCLLYSWTNLRASRTAFLRDLLEHMARSDLLNTNVQLLNQVDTDALTGIGNRRAFEQHIARMWQLAQDDHQPFTLLMADIDHFKAYNDHYGHPAGDACLKRVALALATHLRVGHSWVMRYGGEEFIVLANTHSLLEAEHIAERMVRAVQHLDIENAAHPDGLNMVTISVGACLSSSVPFGDTEKLLHHADAMLYAAKHAGRNQWRLHTPESSA